MIDQHVHPEAQWTETLSALREHLAEVRRALEAGDLDGIMPFAVPEGLPGMPVSCAAEARSLAEEQHQVEVAVRAAMEQNRPTQQRPPQPAAGFRRSRFEARA